MAVLARKISRLWLGNDFIDAGLDERDEKSERCKERMRGKMCKFQEQAESKMYPSNNNKNDSLKDTARL